MGRQHFDRDEALALLAEGWGDSEIAKRFGITSGAITIWRGRNSIPAPSEPKYLSRCVACDKEFVTTSYQQTHCGTCGLRRCYMCQEVKSISEFHAMAGQVDGRSKRCKECAREIAPDMRRRSTLKRWGLTEESLIQMWEDQGRSCAICLRPVDLDSCHMDHDHACCKRGCSKCLRGITHGLCNATIGFMEESPELLRLAASYCERWKNGTGQGRGIPPAPSHPNS